MLGRASTTPTLMSSASLTAFFVATCSVALSSAQTGPRTWVATCYDGCYFYREVNGTLTKTVEAQATCGCSGLQLRRLNLTAVAPDAFAGLSKLRDLDLFGNELSTPPSLTGLTSLQILDLQLNRLTTPPTLTGLTSLTTLTLHSNRLSKPPMFTGLTSLTYLYLDGNQLTSSPSLTGLTSLQTLRLDSNKLTSPPTLSGLTAMQTLLLSNNRLTSPPTLTGLTSLRTLYLSSNSLTTPPSLTGLTSLETVHLDSNKLTSPPTLTGLTALRRLQLSSRIVCIACASLPVDTNVTLRDEYLDEIACKTDCASAAPPYIEPISADVKAMIPVELTQKLLQSQTPIGDWFGGDVSMSGDMVAVMGGNCRVPRPKVDIEIFELSADRDWTQTARIPLFYDSLTEHPWSRTLALSGDTLAISDSNSVVIFARNGREWTRQEKKTLIHSRQSTREKNADIAVFSLDGDTLVMADQNNRSSIIAHRRTVSGVWTEEARVHLPADVSSSSHSWIAVTLSGNTLVVSDTTPERCQILIFERNSAGAWIQQIDVGSFIKQACPEYVYGAGLSLNGNTLAAGGGSSGHMNYTYVFARDAVGLWTLEANLSRVETVKSDWFGWAVSLYGDVLAISADGDDDKGLNAGAVYMYTRANKTWTQRAKLLATDGTVGDRFGLFFALGERTLIIGTPFVSDQGIASGAAYVYSTTPKPVPVTPKNVTSPKSPLPGVSDPPAMSAKDALDAAKAEAETKRKEADEKKQVAAAKKAVADEKKELADSKKKTADNARNVIVAKITDKKLAVEVRVVAAAASTGVNLMKFSAPITASDATAACAQMCTAAKVNCTNNVMCGTEMKPETARHLLAVQHSSEFTATLFMPADASEASSVEGDLKAAGTTPTVTVEDPITRFNELSQRLPAADFETLKSTTLAASASKKDADEASAAAVAAEKESAAAELAAEDAAADVTAAEIELTKSRPPPPPSRPFAMSSAPVSQSCVIAVAFAVMLQVLMC